MNFIHSLLVLLVLLCYNHLHCMSVSEMEKSALDRSSDNVIYFHRNRVNESYGDEQWKIYLEDYGKQYQTKSEEINRRKIFLKNLNIIQQHNFAAENGMMSYTMGVNKYTDMDHAEFVQRMNGLKGRNETLKGATYLSLNVRLQLPDTVDWRTKGYVTPVKDQKNCGSCWAFSATGSLEGQLMRSTGTLVSLSEQNLIDCSLVWGNNGCEGGFMDNAFKYIQDNYGIDTETAYPYTAKDGTCHYNSSSSGGRDTGFVDLTDRTESQLKEAVASVGPVSVGIDASQPSFQHYKDGVYNEFACTQTIDHAVLVIGYGTLGSADYWLVKNSWGTTWGLNGYIMMSRNAGNQCGIASMASYPLT